MTVDESLDLVGVPTLIRERWIAELRAPHRHYHTLDHVKAIIRLCDGEDPVIHAAAWLHDIRYDARASDNEEVSARIAGTDLAATGIDIAEVQRIILDTKYHRGGDPATDLFCDLDLSILGASRKTYVEYARAIRREYNHVPEHAYRTGRAMLLRQFDARAIFKTERFASLETLAHANLEWEIARLESDGAL